MASPGGGKFDREAESIFISEDAEFVIVLVAGGKQGGGFSLTSQLGAAPNIPAVLRRLAAEIEHAHKHGGAG